MIIGPDEPSSCSHDGLAPACLAGQTPSPTAGISHGSSFDGLLVESRTRLSECPPTLRCKAEMGTPGLHRDEPVEQPEALLHYLVTVEGLSCGEQTLGDPGVGVRQTRLRP